MFLGVQCSKSTRDVVTTENIESDVSRDIVDPNNLNGANLTEVSATDFTNINLLETTEHFKVFENMEHVDGNNTVRYFVLPKLKVGTASGFTNDKEWSSIRLTLYAKGIKGADIGLNYDWFVLTEHADEFNDLYNNYKDKRGITLDSISGRRVKDFAEVGTGSFEAKFYLNFNSEPLAEFELDETQSNGYDKQS